MSEEIENVDTRVSPSLHPRNVQEVEGYDSETASIFDLTYAAFDEAYNGVAAVHDARAKAAANDVWTEAQQILETSDYAAKHIDRIARKFDLASSNLKSVIAGLERDLSEPIDASSYGVIAGEIRAHVKAMDQGERMGFVMKLIKDGDKRSAQAILGGPAFLSGLDTEIQMTLTKMFHAHHEPLKAKRLKAANGALELLQKRGGLLFTQMEKAVGASPAKIANIRAKKAAAAAAFTLPEA